MRSEIKIIFWTAALAVLSLGYLTWSGSLALDPENQPGVWMLAFCEPDKRSLDFHIANFGSDPQFKWKVSRDSGNIIAEGKIEVRPGQSFDIRVQPGESLSGRLEVVVINRSGQKLIYKSL